VRQQYKVYWSPVARNDLVELGRYVGRRSKPAAKAALKTIRSKSETLKDFPNRGRVVPELADYSLTLYRELIIDRWRLIYRVAEKTVYVVAIIDARRNVEDILLQRLLRDV